MVLAAGNQVYATLSPPAASAEICLCSPQDIVYHSVSENFMSFRNTSCTCSLTSRVTPIATMQHLQMVMQAASPAAITTSNALHCIALQTWYNCAGQYYCSGSCYQVSCATLALLEVATPPTILLSSEAKTAVPASLTLVVAYGLPVAFNLLPCPSFGRSAVQGYRASSVCGSDVYSACVCTRCGCG